MFPWQQHAKNKPNDIALRDYSQGAVFTWAELNNLIIEYGKRLREHKIGMLSIVALQGKNNLDYLVFYLASLLLGARILGLNPAFSREKTTALCQVNQVELLIGLSSEQVEFCAFNQNLKSDNIESSSTITAFELARTLTLTSGSTGLPKAVIHNIPAHLANAKGVCSLMDFNEQDSWLLSLPLYHVSGQGIVWRWLLQGAELHLPSDNFYIDCVQSTHLSLVPTQAQRLLDFMALKPQSAVKIRAILLGGAHIPTELTQKLTALDIAVYAGYGMTEMASTVFAKKCDGQAGVGKPLLGREFKIVDGEIWLRGAGMGCGYFIGGEPVLLNNDEGWFQTKDLGEWDGKNLFIQGRADNMFISGGENIQPEEIEQILLQQESVNQAFVVPKDDDEFGQRPVAFVEFTTEFNESAVKNLQVWLSDKLERFKQPVAYLPLQASVNGNIKISRKELKQQLVQYLGK